MAVVAGDSGDGIWHDGKLAGNLWATTVAPTPWPWRQWFGNEQSAGIILAGIQPPNGSLGISAADLALEVDEVFYFERALQP